jgi:hypothetical protein
MSDIILESAFDVASLLAVLVAIAAATRIVASLHRADPFLSIRLPRGRTATGVLWLALAALLTLPFLDALGLLRSIPQILSPSLWRSEAIAATTPWGEAPWPLYVLLTDLLLLGAYGAAFASLWVPFSQWPSGNSQDSLPKWQTAYLIAVVASLVYQFLKATILQVLWLRLPFALPRPVSGIVGFWLGWAAGLLFLLIAVSLLPNPMPDDHEGSTAA